MTTACLAFDTSSEFTAAQADELWKYNYRAALLYVPLPGLVSGPGDVYADKLEMLLGKGFQVGIVQHVRNPNWQPKAHNGGLDAMVACGAARTAGYAQGNHIFLDLEGISGTTDEAKFFAETWAANVIRLGYLAGVYCGYQDPLGAQDLYLLHGVTSYWSDAGHRNVMTRGLSIHQGATKTVAGLEIDPDTIAPDCLGDMPVLAQAA